MTTTRNDWISLCGILIFRSTIQSDTMKIGLHGKKLDQYGQDVIKQVLRLLDENDVEISLSPNLSLELKANGWEIDYSNYKPGDRSQEIDCIFSVGGDGTLLETLTHIGELEIPILGINVGRMGYLATISGDNIQDAIQAVINKTFEIDERALLHLDKQEDLFNGLNFALNDLTVLKKDSSMIMVRAYVDGEFLNSYWADGVIVATPTGSTGYSLSCGGPLVMAHSNNFILTPVAPHSLTIRPMVLSSRSEITLEIGGRVDEALVTLDSRSAVVSSGTKLTVRRERFEAKLVKMKGYSNFGTLRQKLNWGLDVRN